MRLPRIFLKEKGLEEKVNQYTTKKFEYIPPGSFDEETLSRRVCKYFGTYHIYYDVYQRKVKEQVHHLNQSEPKVLKSIVDQMDQFEKDLEAKQIPWDWVANDYYSERLYRDSKRTVRNYRIKVGMIYYSKIVNYLPAKAAKFFFDKSDQAELAPTKYDIMGMASYLVVLAAETAVVHLLTGPYSFVFGGAALLTGIVHGLSHMENEKETVKEDKKFIESYKKMQEKKSMVALLRYEKQQIVTSIKEHIKPAW